MAEFCLDCLNRISKTNYTEKDFALSKYLELCEGCGEMKKVVTGKKLNWSDIFKFNRY